MASSPREPALVGLMKGWHARLRAGVAAGVEPRLRIARGAGLVQGERAQAIDRVLEVLLDLAGSGLLPPPSSFSGVSLRAKVTLAVHVDGSGLRVQVGYYGRVPGVRALAEARERLDAGSWLDVAGGAGGPITLEVVCREPARELPVVLALAGGRELALPMNFVGRALPRDAVGESARRAPSLAAALGLDSALTVSGRPAVLMVGPADDEQPLEVDAVAGHRRARVHCVGPLLGQIPWLLGAIENDDGTCTLVVHPRRLPAPPGPDGEDA